MDEWGTVSMKGFVDSLRVLYYTDNKVVKLFIGDNWVDFDYTIRPVQDTLP